MTRTQGQLVPTVTAMLTMLSEASQPGWRSLPCSHICCPPRCSSPSYPASYPWHQSQESLALALRSILQVREQAEPFSVAVVMGCSAPLHHACAVSCMLLPCLTSPLLRSATSGLRSEPCWRLRSVAASLYCLFGAPLHYLFVMVVVATAPAMASSNAGL